MLVQIEMDAQPGTAKLSASGSQKESFKPQRAKISRISLGCGRRESGCNRVAYQAFARTHS
jgi:hypothetical protein